MVTVALTVARRAASGKPSRQHRRSASLQLSADAAKLLVPESQALGDSSVAKYLLQQSQPQQPRAPRLRPSAPPPCSESMPDLTLPVCSQADFELENVDSWVDRDRSDRTPPPNPPLLRCTASPSEMPPPLELPLPAVDFIEAVKKEGGVVYFDENKGSYVRIDRTAGATCSTRWP
eukprot:TRINITY_DN28548_c0_g1_i1.p2 TRINITY_DN28548_c0_g1~~TRINITY_DN28548_c0_g1_i1.p2  ORF type:complete len:176 (+),score=26.56 TRINITY_DN28548_c0_g1_i1:119-646(+)